MKQLVFFLPIVIVLVAVGMHAQQIPEPAVDPNPERIAPNVILLEGATATKDANGVIDIHRGTAQLLTDNAHPTELRLHPGSNLDVFTKVSGRVPPFGITGVVPLRGIVSVTSDSKNVHVKGSFQTAVLDIRGELVLPVIYDATKPRSIVLGEQTTGSVKRTAHEIGVKTTTSELEYVARGAGQKDSISCEKCVIETVSGSGSSLELRGLKNELVGIGTSVPFDISMDRPFEGPGFLKVAYLNQGTGERGHMEIYADKPPVYGGTLTGFTVDAFFTQSGKPVPFKVDSKGDVFIDGIRTGNVWKQK